MKQKIFLGLWIIFLIFLAGVYLFFPSFFEPESIRQLFSTNLVGGLLIYFLLGTLRGFTLIPSTILILAGILVFPPWPLFFVNALCVLTSSSIVYFWGQFLGFDTYFHTKYPQQVEGLQKALNHKELPFIVLWGFFPLVPTDLICYVCETLRIKLWKCLLGVSIGEGVISAIYIFGGGHFIGN